MQLGLEIGAPSIAALLFLSFGLGLRHALEPDHLAAISTIVSDRKTLWGASATGALWGVGHTAALLLVGVIVIVLEFQVSERISAFFEFAVALMLIGLGLNTLVKLLRGGKIHWHVHAHGGITHAHPHVHGASEVQTHSRSSQTHHGVKFGMRPVAVGLLHGLAGSGALMLLILTTIPSTAIALSYILIFGIGSIGGMVVMSTLIGLPFHVAFDRFSAAERLLRLAAGCFSLVFGIFWAYRTLGRLSIHRILVSPIH